jgi:acetylornithine deacetylase/succinyl-diaminopimelate desuccinylase-like protein
VQLSDTSSTLLARLSDLLGEDLDPADLDLSTTPLAPVARLVSSSFAHTVNPTMTSAGQAFNLVPEEAHAFLDCRFVPGFEEEFLAAIRGILEPEVAVELADLTSGEEAPFAVPLVDAMTSALRAEDETALTVPYCAATSSDAASFHGTGIQSYGFTPLKLPAGFDFSAMYHGVDERVPVESLRFGTRVLDRFLDQC